METAQFISIEDEAPDLILSFAIDDERLGVRSLILQRTPSFESVLAEYERGVHVFMEGEAEYEDNLLASISIEGKVVTVSASRGKYKLDIRKVAKEEVQAMVELLKKMNFDSRFQLSMA